MATAIIINAGMAVTSNIDSGVVVAIRTNTMVILLALLLFTLATCGHALSASRKSRRGEISMTTPAETFLLQGVKNLRDLAGSVDATSSDLGISIQSGKVIRLGCPSKATEEDVRYLQEEVGMKGSLDLIDLRSPKEWKQDQYLFQNPVYEDYTNYRYSKIAKTFIKLEGNTTSFNIFTGSGLEEGMPIKSKQRQNRRYFVPLMNTRKIAVSTFKRFRKRTKLSLLGWSLLSIFSRRARKKARSLFIDKLNGGGLSLLNEILIDSSGHEIAAVLKLLASNEEHGAAVYCT